MSQSPLSSAVPNGSERYLANWNALAESIRRGFSFSGRERHCCYLNTGGPRFADVSAATGLDLIDDGRGMAIVDWDQDGDLDLWLTNRSGPRLRMMRNDMDTGNHFVAVRLEGTASNRDGIGARVELYLDAPPPPHGRGPASRDGDKTGYVTEAPPLIRTVRAGERFASQSSKWIHFGLGPRARVDRLVVRWPGAAAETFTEIEADRHYHIIEGAGEAHALAPRGPVHLRPTKPTMPPPTGQARIVLTQRVPLPRRPYLDFDGRQHTIGGSQRGLRLINLWASWCPPCLKELRDFDRGAESLRDHALQVVALCVDGVTGDGSSDRSAARALVQTARFAFPTGLASTELVRELTRIHHEVIYRQRPLPVPTSFLVDADGKIAVIYKGPVSCEQLMSDAGLLKRSPREIRNAALPLAGRDAVRPFALAPLSIARAYLEGDYLDDAEVELKKYLGVVASRSPEGPSSPTQNRRIVSALQLLATIAGRQQRNEEQLALLRQIVRLQPDDAGAVMELAMALWMQGHRELAEGKLERLRQTADDDPQTRLMLGQAWMGLGQTDRALTHLREAFRLSPEDTEICFNLAMALQLQSQPTEAIEHYRWILARRPDWREPLNNLAWVYATDPNPQVRNAEDGLALAQRLCEQTGYQVPQYMDTLAAALASAGRFSEAVEITDQAIRLARGRGEESMVATLENRRARYRDGRPMYVEEK